MKYAWSVPEVTQISQMDCGPSCLKSVLQGFNIPVHFGRLREACQTNVDGTSVDTIEELACELGLAAQQVLVPINHLHLPAAKATPSILITVLPNNLTHFIVLWRSFGPWAQVMNPSHGRHWIKWEKLKQQVYSHRMSLSKEVWVDWAHGDEYRLALHQRLKDISASNEEIKERFSETFVDEKNHEELPTEAWIKIACFDAGITWTESLIKAGALKKGREAVNFFLKAQIARAKDSNEPWTNIIPRQYWWAIQDKDDPESLSVEAAVLVRIEGKTTEASEIPITEKKINDARINETETSPIDTLKKILLPQQKKILRWFIPIVVLAAGAVTLQALLFQGLLGMSGLLGQQEFNSFIPMIFTFIVLSTFLDFPITKMTLSLGRQLENQFRIALFKKIPKIHDPYFRSRLLTEMARRSHRLYMLRFLPGFAVTFVQQASLIVFTLAGIFWLDLFSGICSSLIAAMLLGASIFWQRRLHDPMARAEIQTGVISMFYFDTLKGLKTIRSHAAQKTFENEQEIQLSCWGKTHRDYRKKQTTALLAIDLFALLCLAALIFSKAAAANIPGILWFYWILRLPYLVKHLSSLIMDVPLYRIILSLYTELLEATEITHLDVNSHSSESIDSKGNDRQDKNFSASLPRGAAIEFNEVSLNIGGHQVLRDINLHVGAGEHIAIVGESGAGKSSLCELLLGWQAPSKGHITVDREVLHGENLLELRKHTAWVDANVQLWDRSLLENLNYDHGNGKVHDAGLGHVLAGLADGLQTHLGEDGKRLSGGEGQRVRIARALGVNNPKLIILDEPCRGLDRSAREHLLQKIRTIHANATVICVTHDISEAIKFPRVVVVGQGTLLEQGSPGTLLASTESALSRLHQCEQKLLRSLLQDQTWQSLHLKNGRLEQAPDQSQACKSVNLCHEKIAEDINA